MREYYEFIFTIAENTDKMAKVVYDYTGKLETVIKELDKVSNNFGNNPSAEIVSDTRNKGAEKSVFL